MKKSFVALGLAGALVACNGEEKTELDPPTEATVPEVPEGAEGVTGPNEAELDADAEAMAQSDAAIAANRIPAQFHGRWDATNGACSPDSDGRLEITASEVSFYESAGDVTKVEQADSGVKVSLSMEGEGEQWTAQYTFNRNGEQLDTTTSEGETFTRKRCEG